jgi:hypothetical protein
MLLLIFLILYTLSVFFIIGFVFVKTFLKTNIYSIDILILIGFSILTSLLQLLSLFFGLKNILFHILILLFILYSIFQYKLFTFRFSKLEFEWHIVFLFLFVFFYLIIKSIRVPEIYDVGLYHAQSIRWIEELPVVKGLGNLHGRLAFNSVFFISSAFFSFSFLNSEPYFILNIILFFISITRCIYEIQKSILKQKIAIFVLHILFLLFIIHFNIIHYSSSTSTDFPPLVFSYYIYLIYTNTGFYFRKKIEFVIISILLSHLVLIKLSYFPLILLLLNYSRSKNRFYVALILGLFFIPWFFRNIILSGYLVYPLSEINIFDFDWKIPVAKVVTEKLAIKGWAIQEGENYLKLANSSIKDWFFIWWEGRNHYIKLFYFIQTILLIFNLYLLVKNSRCIKLIFIFTTNLIGLGFWFLNGPDERFAYGYLFINLVFFSSLTKDFFTNNKKNLLYKVLILVVIISIILKLDKDTFRTAYSSIIFPKTIQTKIITNKIQLNSGFVYTPSVGERCFYSELPCTGILDSRLNFRGSHYKDGFQTK